MRFFNWKAGVVALTVTVLASPALAAGPACPSQDFAAFTEDVELQRAYTIQPLEWASIDAEAVPEPAPKTEMLSGDALKFPLILNAAGQNKEGLKSELREIGADREWKLAASDSGAQIRYLFRQRPDGSCWELYKVSDDSI